MKNERLFELLSEIDEEYINESEKITTLKPKRKGISTTLKILAACLCLAIISATVIKIVNDTATSPVPDNSDNFINPNEFVISDKSDSSQSPLLYGNPDLDGNTSGNTLGAEEYSPFAAVTVRLKEALPDFYAFYDIGTEHKYMLLKMEVLEVLIGNDFPDEFYYLIPEGCFTDFSIYDKFIINNMVQYGYEYSVMYNLTKACPEQLDLVMLGSYSLPYIYNGGADDIIAFDENGNFDQRLYESTEGFSTGTGWYKEEMRESIKSEIGTLEDAENEIRTNTAEGIKDDFFIHTFSDFSQESKEVLEYIQNPENGLYVSEFKNYTKTTYLLEKEHVVFRRYIDGIATNETITICSNTVDFSMASFDEAEASSLPPIRSAFEKICKEFEAGNISPPHIKDYEKMKNTVNGIYPWYAKTDEGVVGIIKVCWTYRDSYLGIYADDAYFIVTNESDTLTYIDRDELIKKFKKHESTYIYTGEYDSRGKVYENRDSDYVVIA